MAVFVGAVKLPRSSKKNGRCSGVILNNGEHIESECTIIAPGHSARTLISHLISEDIEHKPKGFQLGCRIEHSQEFINTARYGLSCPPRHVLSAAEYNLVSRPPRHSDSQGVTTFCMCPGGEIIAATSDAGQLSTNGMSRFSRSSPFANAGLICNQAVKRDGNGLDGFDRINAIEKRAFEAGGKNYSCPAQTATDFMRGQDSKQLTSSSYKLGIIPGRIDQILPPETVRSLHAALRFFDKKVPGFIKHGTLVGVETRVSSPVRFERNPETLASSLPRSLSRWRRRRLRRWHRLCWSGRIASGGNNFKPASLPNVSAPTKPKRKVFHGHQFTYFQYGLSMCQIKLKNVSANTHPVALMYH